MDLNQTTKEAQTRLVAGLEPVAPKVRFRRAYANPKSAEALWDENYDFRGTEVEAIWLEAKAEIAANVADSGWPTEYDPEKKMRVIRVTDEGEYELEYDLEALRALGKKAEERGIPNASSDEEEKAASTTSGDTNPEDASPEGWSYGTDLRVSKPINSSYPTNQRELRRIGRLNSGCTAVAVGRRLLLTAAHCVTNASNTYTQQTYRARQSNTTHPYGTVQSVGVHFDIPTEWTDLNCHISRQPVCHQHDWAIIFLASDVWQGQTHPGWMGYHAPPNWSFYETNNELLENGYPVGCRSSPAA